MSHGYAGKSSTHSRNDLISGCDRAGNANTLLVLSLEEAEQEEETENKGEGKVA